jgi:hypothetical protein
MLDTNVSPYFNDFDEDKNFHQVLFVPGNPIQARELSQLQSILQNQIKHNADHIFKNGTMVIPGNIFYDNKIEYVKLEADNNNYYTDTVIDSIKDQTVTGQTSGVVARVMIVNKSTDTDPPTIYIKYVEGNGENKEFTQGEVLVSSNGITLKIQNVEDYTGYGTICSIDDGIYYINGYFVKVHAQSIVLSKYTNNITTNIGLKLVESIVTGEDDETLYDNAMGFSNYAAPGAHRYKIQLILVSEEDISGFTSENFIQLLTVKDGEIQRLINYTKYSEIEKLLARRTYDESGDYVVDQYNVKPYEYRDNDRGVWATDTVYLKGDIVTNTVSGKDIFYYAKTSGISGVTAPSHLYGTATDGSVFWQQTNNPFYNYGLNKPVAGESVEQNEANANKFVYSLSAGKAYIQGFEVSTEHTNIVANKAKTFEQAEGAKFYAPTGSYVGVYGVVGYPNIDTYELANLKDAAGNVTGTAYVRNIEYHGDVPLAELAGQTIYRLFLLGIKMNPGKSFADNVAAINIGSTFSCNIVPKTKQLMGTVSITSGSNVVSGKGTDFDIELKVGSTIIIDNQVKMVASITGDYSLTVNSNFSSTKADVGADKSIAALTTMGEYVVPLSHSYIRTIRDSAGALNTDYTITKKLSFTSSGTSHVYTIGTAGETFDGTSGHITVRNSDGVIVNATYSLNPGATQLTISGITAVSFTLLARIRRSGAAAKEKVKILSSKTVTVTATDVRDATRTTILSTGSNYKQPQIALTEADVLRINKITMSGADGNYDENNQVDITDWYSCDSGIKPEVYAIGSAVLKPGKIVPKRELRITFEYFDHSDGDYFSVDSYQSVPYELIPQHTSGVSLADYLDFRSRMSDDGLGFSGAGSQISEPLLSNTVIEMDYSYYLPRKDVIALMPDGKIVLQEGIPALKPKLPTYLPNSLQIIKADVDAFTVIAPRNVRIQVEEHRRYTMKDINKLDKRLSNVEQIVALTALENDTNNMKIVDTFGLDRYKNGFLVDQFKDHEVGDYYNQEYKCSIDTISKELRPSFFMHNTPLVEPEGTTAFVRASKKYTAGQAASLPFTQVPLINQPVASRPTTINPFHDVNFVGVVDMHPAEDVWFDAVQLADKNTIVEGNYEETLPIAGTVYSAWRLI